MSVSISIEISLSKQISRMTILRKLEDFGWSYNDQGKVTYLPIGDDNDFNWRSKSIPLEELLKILVIKDNKRELIGVAMTWKDTDVGEHF